MMMLPAKQDEIEQGNTGLKELTAGICRENKRYRPSAVMKMYSS